MSCFDALVQPPADDQFTTTAATASPIITPPFATLGFANPADRLPRDEHGDQHERDRVGEGREHADAVIAERHALVGRFARHPDRVPAERQSRRVRQVVSRIREQRQAVAEPPTHRFDEDKEEGQHDGGAHRSARHGRHMRVDGRVLMQLTGMLVRHAPPARIPEPPSGPPPSTATVSRRVVRRSTVQY